jgi:hypothetical protein
MTLTVIIIGCTLLLIAYIFDLTSSKTRIPSVVLLILLGYASRQIANLLDFDIPDLSSFLTIFGTIGLILIVLEGSIDLELNRSKIKVVGKSALMAFIPILVMGLVLAFVFSLFNDAGFKTNMLNMIPLCVISSAIAIPSARNLCKKDKEFIVYESSLSDIIGVLFFTFLLTQQTITVYSFTNFGGQILLMFVISFIATIALVILLSRVKNHIKFAPIIILVVLIYAVAEVFHLPALIFIFIFGLFLGNITKLERLNFIHKLNPANLYTEVKKFKELVTEGAFLIRSMFFLIFGFLIETSEITNGETFLFALLIVGTIFILRYIILLIMKMPADPLLFVAPRGLITILLFLSIPATQAIPQINKSLIIQVILIAALILMFGLMFSKSGKRKVQIVADDISDEKPQVLTETSDSNAETEPVTIINTSESLKEDDNEFNDSDEKLV